MIIVSNTSPLIAFSRINRLDVLRAFAPQIVIPNAVLDEIRAGARTGEPIIDAFDAGDWFTLRSVADSALLALLRGEVDRGEAEAIALALELKGTVLMDDRNGRAAAARLGVDNVGTLGVISRLKQSGVLREVTPFVEALRKAGIYYRMHLLEAFLRAHGEA